MIAFFLKLIIDYKLKCYEQNIVSIKSAPLANLVF